MSSDRRRPISDTDPSRTCPILFLCAVLHVRTPRSQSSCPATVITRTSTIWQGRLKNRRIELRPGWNSVSRDRAAPPRL